MGASAMAFLAGGLAVLLAPGLATQAGLLALASAGLVALCRTHTRWLAFFCAGFLFCHASAAPQLARRQADEDRRVLDARIVSIPVRDGDVLRFDAELGDPRQQQPATQRVRVTWRLRDTLARASPPAAAEQWRLALKLRPPRAAVNPGAVDTERTLFRDRIDALAEVIDSPLNQRVARHPHSLLALRGRLVTWIHATVSERSGAALLAALAVGATGDVSREQWRIFNATGITHLVAISGLHVTLFAWLAMRATAWLWKFAAARGVRVRRDSVTAVAGIVFATAYSLLAGFSVPTQRTLAMLSLFLLWRSRARAAPMSASLALSLVAVLMLDPFAPLGAGLWLSFGAVAAILLTAGTRLRPSAAAREFVLLQLWVTVALLPATLAVFGSVSLAGLLVNIAAIPLFSFVLVPLVLGSVASRLALPEALHLLPDTLLRLAAWCVDLSWPWFATAADWKFALWRAAPSGIEYLFAFLGLAIVLCPWPSRLRASALLLLVPLATPAAPPEEGQMQVSVLDVGQGLAVLLRTRTHQVLYDTGDTFRSRGAPAERAVLPYLAGRSVSSLDLVVLPRSSRDAGDGVTALRSQLAIRRIVAGRMAQALPPEFTQCPDSSAWRWDGVEFELVSARNGSCVLHVNGTHISVLLAGEIDAGSERALLDRGLRAVDIVVIPRHGAANASSPGFVAQLRARWAVASVRAGARESAAYRKVIARWRDSGAIVLDTASSGALRFDSAERTRMAQARSEGIGLWRLP